MENNNIPLPQNIGFKMVFNTVMQVAGTVITSLIGLVITINIARNLKADNFGIYTFAFFFIGLFRNLMYLIADPIAVQKISVESQDRAGLFLGNLLIIKFFLFIIITLITISAVNLLGYPAINRAVVYIGCVVFFSLVFTSAGNVLQANLKMIYDASAGVISALLYLIWITIAFRLGKGLVAVVWGWVICDMLRWLMVFFASINILRPRFSIDIELCREVIKKSFPLWLGAIFIAIFFHADILILSKIKSNYAVGIYGAAQRIIRFLTIFPQAISISAFPLLTKLYVSDKTRYRDLYYRVFDYIVILALPLAIGIFVFSQEIILALFKLDFLESEKALRILIFSVPFLFLEIFCSYTLFAANHYLKSLVCSFMTAVVNAGLNIILIPRYGFVGAAAVSVITHAFLFFLIGYFLYKTEKLFLSFRFLPTIMLINIILALSAIILKPAGLYFSTPLLIIIYFALIHFSKCVKFQDLLFMAKAIKGNNE